MSDDDEGGNEGIVVVLPSGSTTKVRTDDEAAYITEKTSRYMAQYEFVRPGDLGALDSVVLFEMLCWRWTRWLTLGHEDNGDQIVPRQVADQLKQLSGEIRQLKASLGIDRKTIERTSGDGSMAEFVDRLKQGALAMNAHRHKQVDIVLEHAMQLRTMVTIYNNGDEEERELYGCTAEEILHWMTTVFDPAMQAADEHFATHEQSIWIKEMQATK